MVIETIVTAEMQKVEIIKYISVMQDDIVPMFLRKIYSNKCEIILLNYLGNDDHSQLWDSYLIARGSLK
jgi:hypothetical protein